MEDGVWRTVGGRRIFIKDGEDLSTAMKNSGKFKSKKTKEKDYSNTGLTEKEKAQVAESSKSANRELKAGEVKRQKEDIEKASGLKVERSFETDLFGNGKEDRFELSDGRIVSHTTEAMGSKVDKWSVSKYENGSMNSKNYDSYEEILKHLKNSK